MADERIIELDTANEVLADDYLAIDSVSGETRKIKPIKIGATYEIEDGDHEFTLTGSNGYEHTVHLPVDAVSMTQAEYDALTPAQKADGTTRFITDGQSDVESELWSKVGRQTLDTEAQVLSNAVNELKGDIDTNTDDISTNTNAISILNSRIVEQKAGSIVVNNSNTSYATFMTLAQIKTLFNNNNLRGEDIILTVTNGDYSYNSIWIIATAWVGENLTIRFDTNMTKNLRVNYVISIIG